jgi:hypothetical protein
MVGKGKNAGSSRGLKRWSGYLNIPAKDHSPAYDTQEIQAFREGFEIDQQERLIRRKIAFLGVDTLSACIEQGYVNTLGIIGLRIYLQKIAVIRNQAHTGLQVCVGNEIYCTHCVVVVVGYRIEPMPQQRWVQ